MANAVGRRRRSAFMAGIATMAMAIGFTAIPAEAAPPPPHVDLVAIGDSYTAGTGAGDFDPPSSACLQTDGGYVDVLDSEPIVGVVANAACHGALLKTEAQPGITSVMDQIAQLTGSEALSGRTELVTLTAGANDVGVNTVLYYCATFAAEVCQQAVGGAVQMMPSVGANLTQALVAIHRAAPRAKIAVLGYPRLFDPTGLPVMPPENQILVNQGTALLNATIAASVARANALYRANAQFINVTARFAGHEANSPDAWIVLGSTPQGFHPNETGHEQYAAALTAAVNLASIARR